MLGTNARTAKDDTMLGMCKLWIAVDAAKTPLVAQRKPRWGFVSPRCAWLKTYEHAAAHTTTANQGAPKTKIRAAAICAATKMGSASATGRAWSPFDHLRWNT